MECREITTNEAQEIQAALCERIQKEMESGKNANVVKLVSAFKEMSKLITRIHMLEELERKVMCQYEDIRQLKRELSISYITNLILATMLIVYLLK